MSELAPISQVGIAVYNVPLGVEKVPVLCILSMYLLLGLGTDGIFVFVNALARSYVDHEQQEEEEALKRWRWRKERLRMAEYRLSKRMLSAHQKLI